VFGSTGGGIFDSVKYASYLFSMVFYFQSLFTSIEMSSALHKVSKTITERINNIVQFIQDCHFISDCYWKPLIPTKVFGCEVGPFIKPKCYEGMALEPFSLFSNFGSRLKVYKQIRPLDYVPLMQRVYMLDAMWAVKSKVEKEGYTYATFLNSKTPVYEIDGLRHPCLAQESAVTNDIKMPKNILITGPNAGGKSTLIKALLCNAVLAQTLTVCSATSARLTPFTLVHSQINIPDCKGKESLFEAEMHRCKESLDMLHGCKGHSLIVMDEIFNSTNPLEGVSGAYAVAKKLGSCSNALAVISTHYLYLTRIVKEVPSFANYKMQVKRKKQGGGFVFPYKLTPGVCTQFIALDLLAANGFDADIIADAQEVKRKLELQGSKGPVSLNPLIKEVA
jgi:DNA mismatch repair ATPase MutS